MFSIRRNNRHFYILLVWSILEYSCTTAQSGVSNFLIRKPPTQIYFDTVQEDDYNGSTQPERAFTFPSTALKLSLRPTQPTLPQNKAPSPPQMLVQDAMTTSISDLTHAAFSQKVDPPDSSNTKTRQQEAPASSSSSPGKIGGYIEHNLKYLKTPAKPTPVSAGSESQFKLPHTKSFSLETSETGNRGNIVTAVELSGNRPTVAPVHSTTTLAPPTTTTTASPPVFQNALARGRNIRFREGTKVKSPHNYNFAPTQDPITLGPGETDVALDDINHFRQALTTFGSRNDSTRETTTQVTLAHDPVTRAVIATTTTTTTEPSSTSTTDVNAFRIHQGKLITPTNSVAEVEGRSEELPFYKEAGGVFEQNSQLERESRVYPGNYPVRYQTDRIEPKHAPHLAFESPVTYRPLTHDPRVYQQQQNQHTYAPNNHPVPNRFQKYEPAYQHTTTTPRNYRHNSAQDARFNPYPPRGISSGYGNNYGLLPFSTTTTDRTIHFVKKPPPRFDPASDYFYGDPRPPPPAPLTTAASMASPAAEEEADEDAEEEEEEQEPSEEDDRKDSQKKEDESNEETDGEKAHPGRAQSQNGANEHNQGPGQQFDFREGPKAPERSGGSYNRHPEERLRPNFHRPAPPQPPPAGNIYTSRYVPGNDKPFKPSRPLPIVDMSRPPLQQVGFGFEDRRNDFIPQQDFGFHLNPGIAQGHSPQRNRQSSSHAPSRSHLDPIYTMSIRDYDAEVKRRENNAPKQPARPAEHAAKPKFRPSVQFDENVGFQNGKRHDEEREFRNRNPVTESNRPLLNDEPFHEDSDSDFAFDEEFDSL